MKIGVIQASSQKKKNSLLFDAVRKSAAPFGHEVINFGVAENDPAEFSYIEIAVCVSFLLSSKAIDFIVTGCSSGQGMMLACNSLPNVLCGYTPTPQDAFLFGRINDGNAVSLPLGLNFGWSGEINLQCTLDQLFAGPFGTGYPPQDADRKKQDTQLLKQINQLEKRDWPEIIDSMDAALLRKVFSNRTVFGYIGNNCHSDAIRELLHTHHFA